MNDKKKDEFNVTEFAESFLNKCANLKESRQYKIKNHLKEIREILDTDVHDKIYLNEEKLFFFYASEELPKRATTNEKEIFRIANKVGRNKWDSTVKILLKIRLYYNEFVEKPSIIANKLNALASGCISLADEIESITPSKYYEPFSFSGIVAKQVFDENWLSALTCLSSQHSFQNSNEIAMKCFLGLYLAEPESVIPAILRDIANRIEVSKFQEEVKFSMNFTKGKLNEKEFAKRVVFFLLSNLWPTKLSPNKETAFIVNNLLDLKGKNIVTANDISQMNKKTRRKYYKDVEKILGVQSE